jgi:hypothetical protein
MLNGKLIGVVVPAFNEEQQIGMVIEGMPSFVDRIIITNDFSLDKTSEVVESYMKEDPATEATLKVENWIFDLKKNKGLNNFIESNPSNDIQENQRIILLNNTKNEGNGKSIARGLRFAYDLGLDAVSIMDGDGQMDPSELIDIMSPVAFDNVNYVKGNRLIHPSARIVIPKIRLFGNSILSILNKIAAGYWKVSDTQTGYVCLSREMLSRIELHSMYKRYGWPNDLLVKANIESCTIREVGIKPVYNVGEQSKMNIFKVIPKISFLLVRSFFKRLYVKYLIKSFHPIFLLYHFSALLFLFNIKNLITVLKVLFQGEDISFENLLIFSFVAISSFQSLILAMWMDIQDNEKLYK